LLEVGGVDFAGGVFAAAQFLDARLFDIEAHHRIFAGEFHCERQAHVAQADDADADVGRVEGQGHGGAAGH